MSISHTLLYVSVQGSETGRKSERSPSSDDDVERSFITSLVHKAHICGRFEIGVDGAIAVCEVIDFPNISINERKTRKLEIASRVASIAEG